MSTYATILVLQLVFITRKEVGLRKARLIVGLLKFYLHGQHTAYLFSLPDTEHSIINPFLLKLPRTV